jgi:hypothetical protein
MKRYLLIILSLLIYITVLYPANVTAKSYYYSVVGVLQNGGQYNVWGMMIIEESPTPADAFDTLIPIQHPELYDQFPIKAAVLINDKSDPPEVLSGNGVISIYKEFIIGTYWDYTHWGINSVEVGPRIDSMVEGDVHFYDINDQPLPLEMYDTLPEKIMLSNGMYFPQSGVEWNSLSLTLTRIGTVDPLTMPDLDQDGVVDGLDLSIFAKKFGLTYLENLSPPALTSPLLDVEIDNGCSDFSNPMDWEFNWLPVSNATKYNIYVKSPDPDAYNLIIDEIVTTNSYNFVFYFYVPNSFTSSWTWKVRSGNDDDQWSEWSIESLFNVESVNTDCP